jgi:hypothetical protein
MGLTRRVALIDMTGHIDDAELAAVAAAINLQVTRDLMRYWPVTATVSALPSCVAIPPGVWPLFVVSRIDDTTAGFHRTQHYQPYAEVEDRPGWTLAASHEILEMLIDPSGNDLVTATAIKLDGSTQSDADGVVQYLLEICDPCEHPDCAYLVDGVVVSDFCTPEFYGSDYVPGARYTFSGSIDAPRRVLKGGYISWWNAEKGFLERLDYTDGSIDPMIKEVGSHLPGSSLREFVDKEMRKSVSLAGMVANHPILARQRRQAAQIQRAALHQALRFG